MKHVIEPFNGDSNNLTDVRNIDKSSKTYQRSSPEFYRNDGEIELPT